MATQKRLPAGDTGPTYTYTNAQGEEYVITWCYTPKRFTLWKKMSDGYEKMATAQAPTELYSRIPGYK